MKTEINSKNQKRNTKPVVKAVCFVLAVLLMFGIAFIVASYVHKNSALQASSEIKNGLSAYELAVEQGYDGSVQDWLKSLSGKSAYEIAEENGYNGSEKDWAKALENAAKQQQSEIKTAYFTEKGNLVIDLSDGTSINVGSVKGRNGNDGKNGSDGKNGINGINGKDGLNGKNGQDGKDGANGTDGQNGENGADGQDGVGVSQAEINSNGQLVLTFSDGTSVNLDKVVGAKGDKGDKGDQGEQGLQGEKGDKGDQGEQGEKGDKGETGAQGVAGQDGRDGVDGINGQDGADGQDGVGIQNIVVTSDGKLNITLTNGTTLDLGTIKGEKGDKGDTGAQGVAGQDGRDGVDGQDGADGIGISNVYINSNDELELTFSDGQTINLGNVKGSKGDKGDQGEQGIQGEKGEKGDQGEQGLQGEKGDKGETGAQGVAGQDGRDGIDGQDGADGVGIANVTVSDEGALSVTLTNGTVLNLGNIKGADGIGITKSEITADGELELTYTDGTVKNLGKVVGSNGSDGADGLGIKTVTVSSDGELLITYTDNSVVNLGNIKGAKGDKGDKGDKGEAGRGIAKTELVNGELIITYTDGTSDNLGKITSDSTSDAGSEEISGYLIFTDIDENSVSVKINPDYQNTIENVIIPAIYNGKTVTVIDDFENCTMLKQIDIPNSITSIYSRAFRGCTALNSLTIPSSVKYIGSYAFDESLSELYFEATSSWLLYYGTVPVYDAAGGGYLFRSSDKKKVTANITKDVNSRNIYFKEKQKYSYGSTNCYYVDSYNSYAWTKQ